MPHKDVLGKTKNKKAQGWNRYQKKSQHRKVTLEKKIRPPGLEPATFRSQVRRSNHWAIPAPRHVPSYAPTPTSVVRNPRWTSRNTILSTTLYALFIVPNALTCTKDSNARLDVPLTPASKNTLRTLNTGDRFASIFFAEFVCREVLDSNSCCFFVLFIVLCGLQTKIHLKNPQKQ